MHDDFTLPGDAKHSKIDDIGLIHDFVLAGRATFTLRSEATGERYTFRVKQADDNDKLYFVSYLTGPDNTSHYTYLGIVRDGTFKLTAKSKLGEDATPVKAFRWFFAHTLARKPMPKLQFWHMGHCAKCGRELTVPESIATGLGPVCRAAMYQQEMPL